MELAIFDKIGNTKVYNTEENNNILVVHQSLDLHHHPEIKGSQFEIMTSVLGQIIIKPYGKFDGDFIDRNTRRYSLIS